MSLVDNGTGSGMVMPVSPMYGGGQGGFGNGWGGDGWWIILLLLLAGNGGWGNGFGFGGGAGGFAADGAMLYPWMNQSNQINGGFRDQMINDNVTSIRDSIGNLSTQLCSSTADVQQSLCNGFAGVNATVNSGFANAETSANARQMANLQQAFAAQTAMANGFNALGSQFADCCCENRLASADLKYTIATENCADRAALNEGVRDILANQNAGIQRILDQMCNDKIDAKNDEIAQLRQEVLYARGQASQIAQNEQIVNSIYNRLDQCPVGTTPVYGKTPIFTCNNGCGCGCGNNF